MQVQAPPQSRNICRILAAFVECLPVAIWPHKQHGKARKVHTGTANDTACDGQQALVSGNVDKPACVTAGLSRASILELQKKVCDPGGALSNKGGAVEHACCVAERRKVKPHRCATKCLEPETNGTPLSQTLTSPSSD